VAERVASAERPVMLVGVEIRRFGVEKAVTALAQKLGIEVFTTFMGRGLLADSGRVGGTYMGSAGDPAVAAAVEGSDALLMLGVILADSNFGVAADGIDPHAAIIAANGEVTLGFHSYHDLPLANFVEGLVKGVVKRNAPPVQPEVPPTGLVADDNPIQPSDVARAVNDLFRRQGRMPVAADMGDCIFTAMDFAPTRLVAPGYYATMGFGVPAGLGLQVASGERVMIVVGDGAFQMTGWELLNCARYGWDPLVLVFNNASWEMLRAFQPESTFNDLDTLEFAEIARTLGGDGFKATTRLELEQALSQAAANRGRFQLIDVRIGRGVISPRLERFVAGFERLRSQAQ
jgi:indolepyruvate decarboxylase